MPADYIPKACTDYCPLDKGEEDMCLGMAKECYKKFGNSDIAEHSPQNKVLEIAKKIRMMQVAKAEANSVTAIAD